MNKHIEKFARECGAWHQVYGNRTFMIDEHFDIEKFAGLIVQECQIALSPMLRDMISRGQAYDLIKQHFGLKNNGQ